MINRLILWLSLAGMILALHLWVQKARGFDQGCFGLSKPTAVVDAECHDVGMTPAGHLLGVSNAAWGYAFYFGLAMLSFAKIVTPPRWARWLHALGEVGVGLAILYSGYLVFQMVFVVEAVCALCMGSAALVSALGVLHVLMRARGGFQPIEENARGMEIGLAVAGLFAASGVLVGVLLFVNRMGTRPLDQGNTAKELERLVGQTLPVYIDVAKLREMRACHFDASEPALDGSKFIGPETPFLGKADGIPVVVFYDPNCGHCRTYHKVFLKIAETYRDRVRFYVLPRMLWESSLPQVAALKLAEPSGKYFELWERMFAAKTPGRGTMSHAQIAAIFEELGLETTDLQKRLAAVRKEVIAQRDRAKAAGINAAPAVYIGGWKVWGPNQSEECIGKLIERTLSGAVRPPGAKRP